MVSYGIREVLEELSLSEDMTKKIIQDIEKNLQEPVRIIGAGQSGVGKTTLLRSIFAIEDDQIPSSMTTSAISAETKEFSSFRIENKDGFKVEFTDGPGIGESVERDEEIIPQWINKIKRHDLLYWVIDASSRDLAHIQKNMKKIIDETGYRDRTVVVLNKVDQIMLPREEREKSKRGWNEEYNVPTPALEEQIEVRTNHIEKKILSYTGIPKDQIVACSALKRWNHHEVLDTLIDQLPAEKRIKLSANRDVEDFRELMSEDALNEVQSDSDKVQ